MCSESFEKCFSNLQNGEKNLRVYLVNPATDNPWRTRAEYIKERDKLLDLQERQIQALDAIKKSSWFQTIAFIVAIVASTLTILVTVLPLMK